MQAARILAQPHPNSQIITLSDSDIALGGAVLLDHQLYRLLDAALGGSRKQRKRLLDSAATRRGLAYCLGLISPAEFYDLLLIAHIRNRFAHDWPRPTFAVDPVRGLAADLRGFRPGLDRRRVYMRAVGRLSRALSRRAQALGPR